MQVALEIQFFCTGWSSVQCSAKHSAPMHVAVFILPNARARMCACIYALKYNGFQEMPNTCTFSEFFIKKFPNHWNLEGLFVKKFISLW